MLAGVKSFSKVGIAATILGLCAAWKPTTMSVKIATVMAIAAVSLSLAC